MQTPRVPRNGRQIVKLVRVLAFWQFWHGGVRAQHALAVVAVLALVSTACSMVQPASAPLGTEQNPLKLALAPSTETQKALLAGDPLARLLEKETGLRIKLSVPTSHAAVIEAMGTHNVDVAWLAPLAYVLAHERVGADALVADVRGGSVTSVGQIVVRADSGITSIEGLRGKRFAFADDRSAAGYYVPAALLLAQGLDPASAFAQTAFVGSNEKVLLGVRARLFEGGVVRSAGGSGDRGLATVAKTSHWTVPPDLAEQLRPIVRTSPVPNDVVSVRQGVSPELSAKLRDGLLRVAASPAGAATLRELYGIDGLGAVTDAEFESLRAAVQLLGLDLDAELAARRPVLGR
jgi:phosphonate transport system substrate-binding protein